MRILLWLAVLAYQIRNWRSHWRAFWLGAAVAVDRHGTARLVRFLRKTSGGQVGGEVIYQGTLHAVVTRADGRTLNLGCVSRRCVTTVFVNKIRDALNNGAGSITSFKYHGFGTGNTAEAIGDTALVTEVETRGTGTQVGSTAKTYVSVGTVTATTNRAIVEHGLFDASTVGNLADRSVFSVINLSNGDAITFTYTLTISDGG